MILPKQFNERVGCTNHRGLAVCDNDFKSFVRRVRNDDYPLRTFALYLLKVVV